MRKKIVAGNWKMNKDLGATESLLKDLIAYELPGNVSVMVSPTYINLASANKLLKDSTIEIAAQNMHQADSGAFTGEISAAMLKSVGVETVILGHSERRAYFWETNELLATKVDMALKNEMTIIYCFGEELGDRQSGNHFNVVKEQLEEGICHISQADWKHVILAYEPVWAIGTGETASPEQAQEMHEFIRNTILDNYNEEIAEGVSILYGGSVKPSNAGEIFGKPDVDGGLIGGAALDAESFMAIVNAFA